MRRRETLGRTFMAPSGARGVAMMDVLFYAFFGIGFLVMMAMIVFVFRSIGNGKKERDHWKALDDNSSILRR
jgi:Na+/H+ antiporter NhaC